MTSIAAFRTARGRCGFTTYAVTTIDHEGLSTIEEISLRHQEKFQEYDQYAARVHCCYYRILHVQQRHDQCARYCVCQLQAVLLRTYALDKDRVEA